MLYSELKSKINLPYYNELAKGRGQIVTPLMFETFGGFQTTENAEEPENYSPSVIFVPSVVDSPDLNSYTPNNSKSLFYSLNELVTICNQMKLSSSDRDYVIIKPEIQIKTKKGGQHA